MDLPSVSVEFKVVLAIVDSFEGLDDIALSLEKLEKIVSFENKLKSRKPWIFSD